MATPYSIPEGRFYIDESAAAEYAAHGGDEIVMRQLVNLPIGATFDAWIQHIWIAGGEREVTPGEGRGFVHHKRAVLGAEEQITSAGVPSESDASGAVASIQYKLMLFGPLPADDHIGLVRFVPQANTASQTEIVWTIKLKLSAEGTAAFADPKAFPPFLETAISGLLAQFAKNVATPYSLPEGYFYLDEGAAAEYAAQGGDEIVMRQLVNVPTGETLDAWIKHVWIAGTEREVTPGEGRGFVNHKRVIGRLGAEEQIISAGLPSESDASGAVASIQYRVTFFGPLPIDDHMGFVRFVPQASASQTEVVWTIKLKLKAEGSPPFADPKTLPPFLVNGISGLLAAMAKTVEAEKSA